MRSVNAYVVISIVSLFAVACGDQAGGAKGSGSAAPTTSVKGQSVGTGSAQATSSSTDTADKTATDKTGTDKATSSSDPGKTGDAPKPIGVEECDAYFKAVDECIAKKPELKASLETGVKASRDAWTAAAAGPGKDTLKASCKTATDALAQSCK